jgi:hypothetical protein
VLIALVAMLASPAARPQAGASTIDTSVMAGFTLVLPESGRLPDPDMVVIEYRGPVAFPMAENLRAIWEDVRATGRFRTVVLRLDSPGGSGAHGSAVVDLLGEMRREIALTTLVGDGDLCASMCIGLFIQGDRRYASPASAFMFHGASRQLSNIPDPVLTERYIEFFRDRAIDAGFIDFLRRHDYIADPGGFWISGADLAGRSNIVTDLLPHWRPAEPVSELPAMLRGGV